MSELVIKPIARIETEFPEKFGVPRQSGLIDSLCGKIIFEEPYRDITAVRGLEDYSHLWLIWGFSKNKASDKWSATVRPPKLGGNKRMGVFASRSPFRPNPIGLSCVRIEKIEKDKMLGPVIYVCGADMVNNTPIYDIKPYLPYTDSHPDALDGFSFNGDMAYTEVKFNCPIDALDPVITEKIKAVLSQDPHPSYKIDPERVYHMDFSNYSISFKVLEDHISVISIEKKMLMPAK